MPQRTGSRYRTAGGRTVTAVLDLPLLHNGHQCDDCWHTHSEIGDPEGIDEKARAHAAACTWTGATRRPTYWGL
ncbi:hypothetical protein HW130_17275 [Streptomyces sp. PKU-EA00015]|uniref:hypothetical protein n=1 Tax=Streptomyces sp. PKU-EA00015 TaxID=2748326 RepID=UPI0015A0CD83|nr:hypothetical protein [Streptomyces sp. PKU-EA00015]NWF27996.1 hypothetical protein [Streptomyces sp. PKU-EA00015]